MRGTAAGVAALVVACGLARCAAAQGIIAPGAKVEQLADGFKFAEGPAVDAEGNVFFTDQPNDRIMKYGVDGKLSTWRQPCGHSNGLYFARDGSLIACADEDNQLWRFRPDGGVTVLVKAFKERLLNGPNDLWIRPDGGIYFTDPFYKRSYWKRGPMEQDGQGVFYLSADRKIMRRVVAGLKKPNGIIGTPDGKQLYVGDIGGGKTYVYAINPDGTLAGGRVFCEMGSDGMTIDAAGNVYLTGRGVTVFDPSGAKIEHIEVPQRWTANVCFGGKDRRTLFITAGAGLYGLRMAVKGAGDVVSGGRAAP